MVAALQEVRMRGSVICYQTYPEDGVLLDFYADEEDSAFEFEFAARRLNDLLTNHRADGLTPDFQVWEDSNANQVRITTHPDIVLWKLKFMLGALTQLATAGGSSTTALL